MSAIIHRIVFCGYINLIIRDMLDLRKEKRFFFGHLGAITR